MIILSVLGLVLVAFICFIISHTLKDNHPVLSSGVVLFPIGGCSVILYGIAIMEVWGWFICPTFHLEPITIVQAIGLQLVIQVLRPTFPEYAYHTEEMSKEEKFSTRESSLMLNIVYPIITLFSGWIIHFFL